MGPLRYRDFELKIEQEGDHYAARVLHSPAGEAKSVFTLPFSEDRLELLVLRIGGHLRSSARRIHTEEMEAARELGGKLFNTVFSGEVHTCFKSSLEEVDRSEGEGLRLQLRLQEVAELADLPWEFIFDPSFDRFLAQSNQTPIVRYIEMPERIKPLTVNLPLQVLVMISSPADYLRLDVERERSNLEKNLEPLRKEGKVRVRWLEKPTLRALQRCLREREYHVFHFIGHGGFDKKAEEGVLVLEDEQERGWLAGAHRIGTLLHDHRSLRLAVLNSCEGARNSRTDPFAGLATTLLRQGIPAVVAMQFEITDDAAITFAGEFYAALADGYPVDAAVAEARRAIYFQPNDIEWGTPVLYMRSSDGILFNLAPKPTIDKRNTYAQHLYDEGKYRESIDKWKEVLDLDPENQTAKEGIKEAVEKLEAEISELSSDAQKLFEKKRYAEAIAKWEEVLKLDPENRAAIKGIEEAKRILKEIEELNTSAKQLYDKGKDHEAIDKWREVLKLDPKSEIANDGIEKAKKRLIIELRSEARRLTRIVETIALWEEVLKLDPENKEAVEGIEKCNRILSTISQLSILSQRLYDEGKYQEAIDKWKEVLNLETENQTAKDGIEKAEEKLKGIERKVKKYCPECGYTNERGLKYCARCDAKLFEGIEELDSEKEKFKVKKYCPGCGHPNERGLKYCAQCGAKLFGA